MDNENLEDGHAELSENEQEELKFISEYKEGLEFLSKGKILLALSSFKRVQEI